VHRRLLAIGIAAVIAGVVAPASAQAQSGAETIDRAQSWTEAGVGYSGGNYFTNEYGTYRTDCSGYVSMAWGLASSYTTVTLPSVSFPIAKDGLEAGDILLNPEPGTSGHVVLFAGWTDDSRTSYFAYEESPSGGAHFTELPYPYWPGYGTFSPRRYIATTSKTAPAITVPAPVSRKPAGPAPLRDGDFVRHAGQVYVIAGGAPVAVTSWQNVGGRQPSRALDESEFAELALTPADGTFLRTPTSAPGPVETYVVAGGAPVIIPRQSLKSPDAVTVDPAALDEAGGDGPLAHLLRQPADGTVVRTPPSPLGRAQRYVFAGGAPIHMSDSWWQTMRPKPTVTTVAQEALDQAGGLRAWSHVRNVPADDTLLKVGADVYRVVGGVPVPHYGVRGVPVDPAALANAGDSGPWSHLVAPAEQTA